MIVNRCYNRFKEWTKKAAVGRTAALAKMGWKTGCLPTATVMVTAIIMVVVSHISRTIVPSAANPDVTRRTISPITGSPDIIPTGTNWHRFYHRSGASWCGNDNGSRNYHRQWQSDGNTEVNPGTGRHSCRTDQSRRENRFCIHNVICGILPTPTQTRPFSASYRGEYLYYAYKKHVATIL